MNALSRAIYAIYRYIDFAIQYVSAFRTVENDRAELLVDFSNQCFDRVF